MSLAFWNSNRTFAGIGNDLLAPIEQSASHGFPPTLTRFKDDTVRHFSPRYEVTENTKQFRLAVEVVGVKEDDVKVELENDGRILHLSLIKSMETVTSPKEFKLEKRFMLGKNLDTTKLTAHLSNGVLVLTTPKKENVALTITEVPITRNQAPACRL